MRRPTSCAPVASIRAVDVGRLRELGQAEVADRYFVQRMYVGVEPEEQTSRELKDKYGVFAYVANVAQQARPAAPIHYHADLDGESFEFEATKVYVVNSGMMGTGLKITNSYAVDDGLLDCLLHRPAGRGDARGRGDPPAGPADGEGDALSAAVPHDQDRDRPGSARVDRRRVRRPYAGDRRCRTRGAVRCRPLSHRPGCPRSTARSTASTRPSGSPTSGSWAIAGSRRSSHACGWVARRRTAGTTTRSWPSGSRPSSTRVRSGCRTTRSTRRATSPMSSSWCRTSRCRTRPS